MDRLGVETPLSVMKENISRHSFVKGIIQSPLNASSLNQNLEPARSLTMASRNGIGHAVLSQRALTARRSTHIRLLPSLFFTTRTGDAHFEFGFSSTRPCFKSSSKNCLKNLLSSSLKRRPLDLKGRALGTSRVTNGVTFAGGSGPSV